MEKIKKTAQEAVTTTSNIVKNLEQFAQAVALLVIAGFSYHGLRSLELHDVVYTTVFVALVIVGLRATYEFLSFMNRKG